MADPLLSINEYPTDGTTTNFQIQFAGGYIAKEHVSVRYFDASGAISEPDYTWSGDFSISIIPAPAAGGKVRIYRTTPANLPLVDFSDGSVVNEVTLDLNAKQAVFLAAEVRDVISTAPELDDVLAAGAVAEAARDAALAAEAGAIAAEAGAEAAVSDFADTLALPGGASSIGMFPGATVQSVIKWVSPEQFGAVGDGVTDDTPAFVSAIAFLSAIGGGKLLCGTQAGLSYLIGDVEIGHPDIVVEGTSTATQIKVKSGTLGFYAKKDRIHFRHLNIISQGFRNDGLNTRGILYTKGTGSIGHVLNYDLVFGIVNASDPAATGCFSGRAIEIRNGLDIRMQMVMIYKCASAGLYFGRNGTGGADFTTTVFLDNFYVIGCPTYGIDGSHVYRSEFNVIGEYNGTALRLSVGNVDLRRCYFENNVTLGALLTDMGGHDSECYSNNPSTDAISRVRNAIGNADWYTCYIKSGVISAKVFSIQSSWGRDPKEIRGVGTTNTLGIKFNEAIIPIVYNDDLLDPSAWASETTSEFIGWDIANSGFKISTALTGVRGMRQSIFLDTAKVYVVQFAAKNVSGAAISTIHVDGVARTPGVPFTVTSSGTKVVRCFANQSGASENYVQVFRLMEVLENQSMIAKTTDRLLRSSGQRDTRYASAPPVSGYHAVGEEIRNIAPVAGGFMGWVCVTAGNPGTWKTFGPVSI